MRRKIVAVSLEDYSDLSIEDYDQFTIRDLSISREDFADLERSCELMTSLESIVNIIVKDGQPTPDMLRIINIGAEMAVAGTTTHPSYITNLALSKEGFVDRLVGVIQGVFDSIQQHIKKYLDNRHYVLTYFNIQGQRIGKLKNRLHDITNKSPVTISISGSKWLLHGEQHAPVTSFKEYSSKFDEMANTMTPFLTITKELADDDLGTSLEQFKQLMALNSDKYFTDRFKALERTLKEAVATTHTQVSRKTNTFSEYTSPTMLGLAKVSINIPHSSTYNLNDYQSLVDAHRHFYMYVDREIKVDFKKLFRGSITLQADITQAKHLLDQIDRLTKTATNMLEMGTKISTSYAMLSGGFKFNDMRKKTDDYDGQMVLRSTRILNRISAILYDSVASGYNFSIGNVKTALTLVEKIADQLE